MTAVDRTVGGGEAVADPVGPRDVAEDDRALLERLRAGEDSAFGELFARHSRAVRRLAFGLVQDRSEAEDLTAEAFFRVLQAIRRGAGPVDNVRAYLLIVARRVAWEWRARRRDVPVSDEELTDRAGSDPDALGQSAERNLITRAFTSLPERWRSVLWKVEVEGERPAVVATNFGLSANATAALARRARQGLRAAYLQAHLAAERSATGCRDVLEKLGAYTAGSIRGSERRRIRAHLASCPSCTTMHAELQDVYSGLRAHAVLLTAPVVAVAGWELSRAVATTGGLGATVKGLLASAKVQVALAATSAAAVGVLGLVTGPWGPGAPVAQDDLDGDRGAELVITGSQPSDRTSSQTIALTTGEYSTAAVVPSRRTLRPGAGNAVPATNAGGSPEVVAAPAKSGFDEGALVVYRETAIEQRSETYAGIATVYETRSVTEVNAENQTRTYTETTKYTKPAAQPVGTNSEPKSDSPQVTPDAATGTTATTTTSAQKTSASTGTRKR
ncbi:MAG TPA: sigma-70 family RNA polymerase sigma factor [Actinophytocola sp.]|jgi:RNA polymerase sigma factor (sigma-70 family)|uniref:sigma-70 family RNA polymerase sigma factor n=1 Tax=Actinophytocola sp. TaxID=1872138 RepID=UPI002DFAB75F|nr:sigma-70 family RNA polymerase sigma factor [Actinophytocola sp.]